MLIILKISFGGVLHSYFLFNSCMFLLLVETQAQATGSDKTYHTIIELPRKRPALNWKTIFTPRRSHQAKSPRRFKRVCYLMFSELVDFTL